MAHLILLHGFSGAPASFRAVRRYLTTNATVVAPLLPGHLDAPPPSRLEDAFHVIESAVADATDQVHLAGYSLGGRIALHYALARPERIAQLTLFGSRPGISNPDERDARLARDRGWARMLREQGLEEFVRSWESQALLRPRCAAKSEQDAEKKIRLSHTAASLALAMECFSVAALPDLWPRLTDLPVPTLWVAGEHDASYRTMMNSAAERSGDCDIIAGSGHAVLLDAPKRVAELLASRIE